MRDERRGRNPIKSEGDDADCHSFFIGLALRGGPEKLWMRRRERVWPKEGERGAERSLDERGRDEKNHLGSSEDERGEMKAGDEKMMAHPDFCFAFLFLLIPIDTSEPHAAADVNYQLQLRRADPYLYIIKFHLNIILYMN